MPNAIQPRRTSRSNTRTSSSAAAFHGCIGLPDTSGSPLMLGDGGLENWCARHFLPAFDRFVNARPELRAQLRASGEIRG